MRARLSQLSVLSILSVLAVLAALLTPAVATGAVSASGVSAKHPHKWGARHWLRDPRSSGALNLLASRDPGASPPKMFQSDGRLQIAQTSVNNPGADATAQDTQSETSIAAIGGGVTVAYNDSGSFTGANNQFTGYARSGNNGLSFADRGALPASSEGDGGDPVLAADQSAGSVYMATLGFSTGENIQVFKSTDGGVTFGAPVNGTPGYAGTGDFQDKNWVSVDNFAGVGQHNVYLCWTRFGAAGQEEVRFTSSTDGGATFGPSLGTLVSTGGQGCFLTVSPDHSVSMFYYRGTGVGGQGGDNKLLMRRSTDRGATFGAEVQVADLLTTTVNGDLGLVGGFRTNSFPHAAVNPVNGNLYVVYNDNPADADNADVFYVKSLNNGATWSAPVQVNNDDTARDQFMPTVAVSTTGTSLMFGYYSRANDGVAFHRQGRIGTINTTTGSVALKPSFQLGPDTPIVLGQDPVINATYMGDYDQIASTSGFFHSSWADNRKGDTFHAHQPDVQYARINATAPSTDPAVALTAPASATVGTNIVVRATLTNSGVNRAEDLFSLITLPAGLVPKAAVPSSGGKCSTLGQQVGCTMGSIDPGVSKTVDITAFVTSIGTKTTRATLTTSGTDASTANNTGSAATSVTGAGVAKTYSTGNIAVPIPDTSSVDIPLDVPDEGSILSVSARVRLDHTFDGDLSMFLISPVGTIVELSSRNGGAGDNYGSGTNTCAGTRTVFTDTAATSITAGVAPFAGTFKPEQAQGIFASENPQGGWVLRVVDSAPGDLGTVGCVQATITRSP